MKSFRFGSLLLALIILSSAGAQQPDKGKGPPAINPAQAKLDQTLGGLAGPGLALAQNDEAGLLAAACEQGTIEYWHRDVMLGVRVGDMTPHILQGHQGPVLGLAWAGGKVMASAGADQKIILWEMPTGKPLHTLATTGIVRALAMSPDGKTLASANDDGSVQLWDTAAGKPTTKLAAHTDWVLSLAFNADGKQLASGGYDGVVRLWDVTGGKKRLDIKAQPPPPASAPKDAPQAPANIVSSLAFSADGKTLAIGGSDAQIHLVNPADGKIIRSLAGHTSTVTALAFHPGGTLLVSGSKDRSLRLWNPANGQPYKTLEGHAAWVQGVGFFAQNTRLASVGADQTVRLWDLTGSK